ncbi:hypothetical protein EMIHUDRAFT_255617 [Emiliania huxleyi CCMP1516]|uniref:Protein phosphatase inhibitor 2 n=2 Tax=Emiliania huxleyi TaxID=2903 RepID=A0A0D3J845_EMIH1|nr:hypothetical protein EMIHUDRAFT_255617 [Emiliania huxleyi CCMP1516]EOD19680.1 hypothetical protein EMIHUDRAFT_255617 [Emiliania huxleyi CCMP1516]|eukprot:XP_005772109.1 hypothetical protein EMIHUDRAFT_255617 [Emiliania huxleyi CCMP1516]
MSSPGRKGIRWDEPNLQANAEYAAANPKMKIDEPKTPYHYGGQPGPAGLGSPPELSLDGDEGGSCDRSSAAEAANGEGDGAYHEKTLTAGMHDPVALSASALERRRDGGGEEEETSPVAGKKQKKFDEMRRAHYRTGGLAALRAQAEADDDEDEDESQPPPAEG